MNRVLNVNANDVDVALAGTVIVASTSPVRPLMMNVDHDGRNGNNSVTLAPKLPPLATTVPPRLTEYDPTPLPQHRPSLPTSTIVKFSVSPATPQYDGSTPFDADEPLSSTRRPGPIIGSGGAVMVHDTSVGALSATNVTAMA